MASGVVYITASKHSFAALKSNGSVVVWGGDQDQAADSSAVQGQLQSGVEKIYANDNAFAALKSDGSIVAWGNDELGGSTRFATGGTLSGIVNLAEVFTDELIGQSFAVPDPVDDFLEGQLIQRVEISPADTITSEKKKGELLSGTKKQDLFLNGVGNNRFRGRKGSDIFWFDRDEKFGKRHAERILDYKPSKDVIIFGGNRFAGMSDNPEFLSVKRKADFNAAMKTESEFVYWSAKGGLYFNANGDDRGAGDGGLFALLSGKPALTVESIGFTE